LRIVAQFVTSAAGPRDFPREGTPEVALAGRSNVGKSSLINALAGARVARTSAAPGKTRLINVYRLRRGAAAPLYLIDLPGYGYARGGREAAAEFGRVTRAYVTAPDRRIAGVLLLVDARHPGLASDRAAYAWLRAQGLAVALVATKIDKLTRTERLRAERAWQLAFDGPVLPVSAVTGEGLDDLWTLIARLPSGPTRVRPPHPKPSSSPRSKT
jgi:GTP-binding protein